MNFQGLAYRAHNPRWSWAPMSGEGAALHGGRFNPKGLTALYLSLDHTTAILEASQGFGLKIQPLTLVTYDVDCLDIVDLTSTEDLAKWKFRIRDLACAWKSLALNGEAVPTWQMVERLRGDGKAGVLVRSFAPGATEANRNLVLWSWGNDLPHRVRVVDDQARLPRNDRSWRDPS